MAPGGSCALESDPTHPVQEALQIWLAGRRKSADRVGTIPNCSQGPQVSGTDCARLTERQRSFTWVARPYIRMVDMRSELEFDSQLARTW